MINKVLNSFSGVPSIQNKIQINYIAIFVKTFLKSKIYVIKNDQFNVHKKTELCGINQLK